MSRFVLQDTPLDDLVLLDRQRVGDPRGFLDRLYCDNELSALLSGRGIEQVNHTFTPVRGTVRGMHFQYPPDAEIKLVSCLRGEVFDVAVDLRAGSSTFLQWYGVRLSGESCRTLLIPEGFAHGFQTLADDCEMLYFHTAAYAPESEGAVNALDPVLDIHWPLDTSERSERDKAQPLLDAGFTGVPGTRR